MAAALHGKHPQAVVELLKHRRDAGYLPGRDHDGARLALVIEGGAMRGAASSGAVDALYQLGFGQCFDEVWGNSAGALNAAYFVSGQITLGTTIYYQNATDPAFIRLRNWPDPLNVDWLIRTWIAAGKALDIGAVMRSPTDLYLAATNVATGCVHYFSNRDARPDLIIPALEASCSVPLLVTKRVLIDGVAYNDGLVEAGIPLAVPAQRCTHVVAALTRELGYRKRHSRLVAGLESLILRRYSSDYLARYHRRHEPYNAALEALTGGALPPNALIIAPAPGELVLRNQENRPAPLKQAVGESMRRVEAMFGAPPGTVRHFGETA